MPIIRLLSYNIRSLRDDQHAVARVIREAAPHVVAIQEAPRFFRWRSKCAALARESGLVVVTGGRPAAANMIMSTLAVEVVATRDFLFKKNPKLHQRGTAVAVCSLQGTRFAIAGTHLAPANQPRLGHIGELRAALDEVSGPDVPQVIAGDFNEIAGQPGWDLLCERSADAWASVSSEPGLTSTAINPTNRVDGMFVDPRMTVVSVTVIGTADVLIASDPRPVLVEVDVL